MRQLFLTLLGLLLLFSACQNNSAYLKVAATSVPHGEMLEFIKDDLAKEGILLKILIVDDYNIPNRLLTEGEVDANFFQHEPFLEKQNKEFGFDLAVLAKTHIEPLGLYSKKIKNIADIKEGAIASIPNDPTNEARALFLLEKAGLIKLREGKEFNSSILDITANPLKIRFKEIDAAFLPRTIEDVDFAVIPANFALSASLLPLKDALILESIADSPYANIIAVQKNSPKVNQLNALKSACTSSKMQEFILKKYSGGLLPVGMH